MDKTLIRLLDKVEKKYERGVQGGWRPDDVHDYRVAIRKARAYLKFWRSDSNGSYKQMKNRLRFLQRQTALVREWDVFFQRFGEAIDERAAEKGKFARFLLVEEFQYAEALWKEVHKVGLKMKGEPLSQTEEKLRERIFRMSEADYVDWHRLRILIKGYRYTLERKSEVDQELVALLVEWQDLLGLIQDGYTNTKWFDWLGEREAMVRHANDELLETNLRGAENKLPDLIEILQRQHP